MKFRFSFGLGRHKYVGGEGFAKVVLILMLHSPASAGLKLQRDRIFAKCISLFRLCG